MRVKINKAAAASTDADAHELTNIMVKEVSVVDRAANKRKFLVTKSEKDDDEDLDLTTLPAVKASKDDLDVKLDARDAANVTKTDAQKALDEKDAKDKAEYIAEKARLAAVTPVVPVDALKSLQDLAATVVETPIVPTKKDDLPVSVTIVPDAAPLSPSAESLKSAILAGIELITTKVGEWRTAVNASNKDNTDVSGRPYCMWEYSYYLTRMIENLSGIGGPEWDVLNATIGKADITKAGNKAITAARVGTLTGVHKGMQHCTEAMTKVMKELTDEGADEVVTPDAGASFAKAAPVVASAPAAAPVAAPVTDPAILAQIAALTERVTKSDGVISSLRNIAEAQAAEIAKSRSTIAPSNVISSDNEKVQKSKSPGDNIDWSDDLDLAPPRRNGLPRKTIF